MVTNIGPTGTANEGDLLTYTVTVTNSDTTNTATADSTQTPPADAQALGLHGSTVARRQGKAAKTENPA